MIKEQLMNVHFLYVGGNLLGTGFCGSTLTGAMMPDQRSKASKNFYM
jgi:hypothetical protein